LAGSIGSADGSGTAARFHSPTGITVDGSGNLFVADTDNNTIRKVTPVGAVTTLAAGFNHPSDVTADGAGDLFVADTGNNTIRKVIISTGAVSPVAGQAGSSGSADGNGSAARFSSPEGVAVDNSGNLYIADTNNHTIRKIAPSGAVSTLAGFAGTSGTSDGVGSGARFQFPSDLAVDGSGNLYVADTDNHTIRIVSPAGVVGTVAGQAGFSGSTDGTGSSTRFYYPAGVAVDGSGNVYVADTNNNSIRISGLFSGPVITTQPQSQTVNVGANVSFSVSATGVPAPTYQWQFNGTVIAGATGATFSLNNVQTTNAGTYTVIVTNSVSSTTSNGASLTVNTVTATLSGSSGSGGGGGGAMQAWFVLALIIGEIARRSARRP
jgi:sugar lactone lactonase YvrE